MNDHDGHVLTALAKVAVFKVNSESERSRWSRFDGSALAKVAVFKVNSESERSRWSRFDGSSQGGRFQG